MAKGKHPVNALTAVQISKLSAPGRYADGSALHLVIDKSGAKRWVLRTVVKGRRRDMGLGGVRTVSLAQARATAQRYRATARNGGDPLEERHRESKAIPTFEKTAFTVHKGLAPGWKNAKHAAQWINTLKRYAFPVIGPRPVSQITSADVLRILSPIWTEKPETARRLSQRISAVPASRMKIKETHRVPLTSHAMDLLDQARALSPESEFIFPNQITGKPLSYNTLLFVLQRRLGLTTTVHGLRSSFKDWASETTNFSNEVSEMALSHKIPSKVESAYRRGDLLEKRRHLMAAWGDYVYGAQAQVVAVEFGASA
jgi:integrase